MRLALLALLLTACVPTAPETAVDQCELKEYLAECESELATPEESETCKRRAPKEATRILAGIPLACRPR